MKNLHNSGAARAPKSLDKAMRLPLLGAAMLGTLFLSNVAAHAVSTTIVISEFRSRGATGTNDDFAEIYNLSSAPVDISGYKLNTSTNTSAGTTVATVPANTILQPGQHFLFTCRGPLTSYTGPVQGDLTYINGIPEPGGIAILTPDDVILDQAGNASNAGAAAYTGGYKEGNPIVNTTSTTGRSFERKPGGTGGSTVDTDDNLTDFSVVNPSRPQNMNSPFTPPPADNTAPIFPAASYTAGLNDPLSIQLKATDSDPLTYTSANLPAGITLSATGLLTGTPTLGNFLFQVTVDDGRGGTATANIFIAVRDVAAGTDTLGPVITHNDLPSSLTRDELAAFTVSGTVRDVAPGTITPAGVRRVLVNLRTGDNLQAYNGSEFTTDLNRGYYIATQSTGTIVTAPRNYSRALAFVPTNLPAGPYILVLYPQDLAGNYSAEFLQFTVTAPATPPANTKSSDVNSGGTS